MRPYVGKSELREIQKVFQSKFLTEGIVTQKFEKSVAHYVKSRFSIATTSATTALHASFEAMGVRGKKVLVSDFTFPATALAIQLAGGIPVLVDVDKEVMNVTRDIIEQVSDKESEFISPVSLFGNPLDLEFYKLQRNGFKIIEDAATNLGSKIGQKFVGSLADITCFSFHPRKIITTGEGGMITTNSKSLASSIRAYKTFGKINSEFVGSGTNYKLSDILSAVGLSQMSKIEKIIKNRIKMAKIYYELLEKIDSIEPQLRTKNSRHTFQSYVCYITKEGIRNKLIKELARNNIESQIGTYALHCLPAFKKSLKRGNLSNSEFLYKNSISLPMHEELTSDDQQFICKSIKDVVCQ